MNTRTDLPSRIVDLHTHLFNARYVPLASIIADAMKRDESRLANAVARLLEALTGSSYEPAEPLFDPSDEDAINEYCLEELWKTTEFELLAASNSLDLLRAAAFAPDTTIDPIRDRELVGIIAELSEIDYLEEGWVDAGAPESLTGTTFVQMDAYFGWARKVVRKALEAVAKLMDPNAWGHAENYLEFFLTMLKSEEAMVEKIFREYGSDLPAELDLQIVHLMMDMQMAYPSHKSPRYPFYPEQLERMQLLQRSHPAQVLGFSAFDPRRNDWKKRADDALARGFIGFKFYPAMGYLPSNDPDHHANIEAFFDYCVGRDVPVFTHCTPEGFQTRKKTGVNAHPKYWQEVLADPRWNKLRLCLGHAGGAHMSNAGIESHGWAAKNPAQWDTKDNFARIVVDLCVSYPNVYCELGYITSMLDSEERPHILQNFDTALKMKASYRFRDKVAYGSDWHMPSMVDTVRRYLDSFLDLFGKDSYAQWREDFFWKNAYRYLKLPIPQD